MTSCRVESCERPSRKRGMCNTHYEQQRRSGALEVDRRDPVTRFWSRVDKTATCWIWTAAKSTAGYGRVQWDGRLQQAHRVAYELLVGPIPAGLDIDHLCRTPACVNPAHLEPVTRRVNVLRGIGPSAANAAKDGCANGHEFTPENTYMWQGSRHCATCRSAIKAEVAQREKWDRNSRVREHTCVECGRRFEATGGRPRRLCSDECRLEAGRRAARECARRRRAAA